MNLETYEIPTFLEEPSSETLFVNQEKRWELPDIVEGTFPLAKVHLELPDQLQSLVSYDSMSNSVTFSGSEDTLALSGTFTAIMIRLVDENGNSKEYV